MLVIARSPERNGVKRGTTRRRSPLADAMVLEQAITTSSASCQPAGRRFLLVMTKRVVLDDNRIWNNKTAQNMGG